MRNQWKTQGFSLYFLSYPNENSKPQKNGVGLGRVQESVFRIHKKKPKPQKNGVRNQCFEYTKKNPKPEGDSVSNTQKKTQTWNLEKQVFEWERSRLLDAKAASAQVKAKTEPAFCVTKRRRRGKKQAQERRLRIPLNI